MVYYSQSKVEYTISTMQFHKVKQVVTHYTQERNYQVINLDVQISRIWVQFWMPVGGLNSLDSLINTMGFINYKQVVLAYDKMVADELNMDINFHKKWKTELEYQTAFWKKDTSRAGQEKYQMFLNQLQAKEVEINSLIKKLNSYELNKELYLVSLSFNNSESAYDSKLSNVRMPGVEYTLFFPSQPESSISTAQYSGLTVRYIFTNGKDYVSFSALKSQQQVNDSSTFKQFFNFMVAQDYYSRRYGEGKRKFFNPYIGYQTGFQLATNKLGIEVIPVITPTFGLELYKSKWMMLDVHAHYQLPITHKFNGVRGWMCYGGLNFTF